MVRTFFLTAAFLFGTSLAHADVITSTTTGGPWLSSGTWVGGVIPDGNDAVVLQGPVVLQGAAACLELDVLATGSLTSGLAPSTLSVGGGVTNEGTIADGPIPLKLEIGGNLTNHAQWTNRDTFFTGSADHHLIAGGVSKLETNLLQRPEATGEVIVETPLAILGDIDMNDGRMRLEPN